jgi:hypothetical protein
MKTLQITLFAIAILFATSCKKDKNGSGGNYRIKQILFNGGQTATYQYNSQNQIIRIDFSPGYYHKAVYNSSGKINFFEVGGNSSPSDDFLKDYIYNPQGIVQEEIFTDGTGAKSKVIYKITNGLQTGYQYYTFTGGAWKADLSNSGTYSYNDSNQKIRIQSATHYTLYEYDERGNMINRKYYEMKSDNSGFYLYAKSILTCDNKRYIDADIIKNTLVKNNYLDIITTTYLENGMIDEQTTIAYTYEYNDAGYVTKKFYNGVLQATYTLEKI